MVDSTGSPVFVEDLRAAGSKSAVRTDLAASATLAASDEQRAAAGVKIGLSERQRFLGRRPARHRTDDQAAKAPTADAVAGGSHDGDDLLDRGRVGRIAKALLAWRPPRMESRHRRGRTATTGGSERQLRHGWRHELRASPCGQAAPPANPQRRESAVAPLPKRRRWLDDQRQAPAPPGMESSSPGGSTLADSPLFLSGASSRQCSARSRHGRPLRSMGARRSTRAARHRSKRSHGPGHRPRTGVLCSG